MGQGVALGLCLPTAAWPAASHAAGGHRAGGQAVLAHPYQLGFSDEKLERTLQTLKDSGLDGLECYYPRHTPEMVQHYLTLAKKYNLSVSAGSDFHGETVRPDTHLTPTPLELNWLSV